MTQVDENNDNSLSFVFYQRRILIKHRDFIRQCSLFNIILVLLVYIAVLLSPPATGYELNIYSMYHPIFWLIVSSIIALSTLIIILSDHWKITRFWIFALLSILAIYYIIMILPIIRGYYMFANGSSDIFAHLYRIQYIVNTGTINTVYPGIHTLLATFQLANIPLETAAASVYALISILYILFICILSKTIQRGWISLVPILFTLPLLYGSTHLDFRPFTIALFFIPLFLYLLMKNLIGKKRMSYSILLIITSFFIIFVHQMIAVILILFTFVFLLTNILVNTYGSNNENWKWTLANVIGILAVGFFAWYLSFRSILNTFGRIFDALFQNTSHTSILEYQTEIVGQCEANITYMIKVFILNYGSIGFYLLFGLICTLFVLYTVYYKKNIGIEFYFGIQYFFGILLTLAFLTGYFVIFEPLRAMSPAILMATIIVVIVIPTLISTLSLKFNRERIYTVIFVVLTTIALLQIFTLYDSPNRVIDSKHFSYMEKSGVDWFIENKEDNIPTLLLQNQGSYWKYELFYQQQQPYGASQSYQSIQYNRDYIPAHFGYPAHTTLSKSIPIGDYYYLSRERSRIGHLAAPEHRQEYLYKVTHEDFDRLKIDQSIDLLYENKEFEVWASSIYHGFYQ